MTHDWTPDAIAADLIAQLRAQREAAGLPQIRLDERAGWADGLAAKLEAGLRRPSMNLLALWAAALACRIVVVPIGPRRIVRPYWARRKRRRNKTHPHRPI